MTGPAALRRFVAASSNPDSRARWREVFTDPIFRDEPGWTAHRRYEVTYARLRHLVAAGATTDRLFLSDRGALADVLGWAAAVDPSLFHAMNLNHCLFAGTIATTSDNADADLTRHTGDIAGSFLMTEAGRASSHLAIATTARFDRDRREFVLDTPEPGATKFPTNAGHPRLAKTGVVFARLLVNDIDHGVFTFITPLRTTSGTTSGILIRPTRETSGLPLDYAAVSFDSVRLPYDAWMSDGARINTDGTLHDPVADPQTRIRRALASAPGVWRAIITAARAVSQSAVAQAISHANARTAAAGIGAGRPLSSHRSHQLDVIGALADAYALTAVEAGVAAVPDGADAAGVAGAWTPWSIVDRNLPLLKAACIDLASNVVDTCRERSGAPAMTATDMFSRYRGLLHAYRTAGGDNTVTRWDIGRLLIESVEDEPGAVEPADDTPIATARHCEHLLAARLATAIRRDRAAMLDEFSIWDGRLDLVDALARVHGDRIVMQLFADAIATVTDTPAERPLRDLAELHGQRWITRHAAILAECGLADRETARARARQHELCARLSPIASDLVAAFDMRADIVDSVLLTDDPLAACHTERP